jgi:hypothetical protein
VQVCFKKAADSFYDFLIRLRTGSRYVHSEILFTNGVTWRIEPGDHPAVGFHTGEEYPSDGWDLFCFPARNEAAIYEWARTQNGKAYDWIGILNYAFPFGEDDDRDLYCSEGVTLALQKDGWLLDQNAKLVSPGKLHDLLCALPR